MNIDRKRNTSYSDAKKIRISNATRPKLCSYRRPFIIILAIIVGLTWILHYTRPLYKNASKKLKDKNARNELRKKYFEAPQVLDEMGEFKRSARPYLSQDIWLEIVDNENIFFVRPHERGYPKDEKEWMQWLDKQTKTQPVNIIMNNQRDEPWPYHQNSFTKQILTHPNLQYLYVVNPILFHDKVKPLPTGLKFQHRSIRLYGEPKHEKMTIFESVSISPNETRLLLKDEHHKRTLSVWVRPMKNTGYLRSKLYPEGNNATRTRRRDICNIMKVSAPNYVHCTQTKLTSSSYFKQLTKYAFVASPPGRGYDSHATWEALLAGCIPIVPRSTLDPMFENLPVWLIDDWREVTDEEVEKKYRFFQKNIWNWEKIFVDGWIKEIMDSDLIDDIWSELP